LACSKTHLKIVGLRIPVESQLFLLFLLVISSGCSPGMFLCGPPSMRPAWLANTFLDELLCHATRLTACDVAQQTALADGYVPAQSARSVLMAGEDVDAATSIGEATADTPADTPDGRPLACLGVDSKLLVPGARSGGGRPGMEIRHNCHGTVVCCARSLF
jgi:hypothetical protein